MEIDVRCLYPVIACTVSVLPVAVTYLLVTKNDHRGNVGTRMVLPEKDALCPDPMLEMKVRDIQLFDEVWRHHFDRVPLWELPALMKCRDDLDHGKRNMPHTDRVAGIEADYGHFGLLKSYKDHCRDNGETPTITGLDNYREVYFG